MLRIVVILLLILKSGLVFAKVPSAPLPVDQAFKLSAFYNQNQQVVFQWQLAPSVYLYRDKIHVTPMPENTLTLGRLVLPAGQARQDTVHGKFQAYFGQVMVPLSLRSAQGVLAVTVSYQGCSTEGFCYAPVKKILLLDMSKRRAPDDLTSHLHDFAAKAQAFPETDSFAEKFFGHNLVIIVLSFLGLGLLLAFTPCSLPMVPILSGIILGHKKKTAKKKAFLLSLIYVAGMAMTYAIAGIVIALIGSSIQAELQKPWIIVLLSGIFILLALSLFGFYELRLPSRWQQRVNAWSNRQKGGTYLGVFLMGCLSTLIISPCVSAPLVGVLAYIGQTGDVVIGALALLALGIGMGIPLLLIGVSADRLLPKAGAWLVMVERLFGLLMLGVAIWMLSRMIPGPVTLFLWSVLFGGAAVYLMFFIGASTTRWRWLCRGAGVSALTYAVILLLGALMGNADPLQPWEQVRGIFAERKTEANALFQTVRSMAELDQQLASDHFVILDFYADWCVSCAVMERKVFGNEKVQQALKSFVLLRADVTASDSFDRALSKRFGVVGPPTVIFFDRRGQELTSMRIVGEVGAQEFLMQLKKAQAKKE